jgi:hypothetical protein
MATPMVAADRQRPERAVVGQGAFIAAIMVRACVVASLVAWSATAEAYMGYPPVVDTWLGKDGLVQKIEPTMGCQLCHVNDQGGTVELKPFGNLLVASYGLPKTAEEDVALRGALAELQAANPTLFADMQKGIDPNDDPALTAHELPQPEYGCSTATARPRGGPDWAPIFLALVRFRSSRGGRRRRLRQASPRAPG